MPDKIANYVVMQSSDTGTANLQLESHDAGRYRDFLDEYSSGGTDVFKYTIVHQDPPGDPELEFGKGHINGSGDLVRDTVIDSSNNDNPENFSPGKKIVSNRLDAIRMLRKPIRETDTDVTTDGSETILTNLGSGTTFSGTLDESVTALESSETVEDISFSHDDKRMALVGEEQSSDGSGLYIYDTSDWSVETTISSGDWSSRDVRFSPEGSFLASIKFNDNSIRIYETGTWNLLKSISASFIQGPYGIAFTPDESLLAFGHVWDSSNDENVQIYNTSTWSKVTGFSTPVSGDLNDPDEARSLDFSPDGNLLAVTTDASSNDKPLFIYERGTWTLLQDLDDHSNVGAPDVKFSPDGQYLAEANRDNNGYIFNVSDWTLNQTLSINDDGRGVSWSGEGFIAFSARNGDVTIFNQSDWSLDSTLSQGTASVRTVEFSKNADVLVFGEENRNFHVYNAITPSSPTITLESDDASLDGVKVTIKDNEGFANQFPITIDTEGSETIDGLSSIELDTFEGVTEIISFNGNWVEL